ncbi:MAG: PQQ-dependent sugar dehydrogenase [Flavobacteriaceae bacterium]|nr:PQQ-dependent sugar dehydrogenase [Flavobacteriaceae bacterium]
MKTLRHSFFSLTLLLVTACDAQDHGPKISTANTIDYSYEIVADGIDIPWGLSLRSANDFLVTEKAGTLYHVLNGEKTVIKGLPPVYVRGQGGLLDVAHSPNYEEDGLIFFTTSSPLGEEKGGHTALYSAQLKNDSLVNTSLLYKGDYNTKKGQHWGSRIAFDAKGHIYFSIGDRGNRELNPQDISRDGGKIYRLNLDGSIPDDNPFNTTANSRKAIYSFGHRNPQGMITHPDTGQIWVHEHGPRGGDEINIVKAGKNYGWPLITYGINYSGTPITDSTEKGGMEQPLYYWLPSIAPSGMAFSTSDVYPNWKNNLFVGSLRFEYLERLVLEDNEVIKREKVLDSIGRIRNVEQGPDGYLYIGVEGKGILKIIPKS